MKIVETPWISPRGGRTRAALLTALTALTSAVLPPVQAAPQPAHNVSAANINVVQIDTGNTSNSVVVTTTLSVNDLRIRDGSNRGDYNLQVGDTPGDDLTTGLVMTSVTENGRDNL